MAALVITDNTSHVTFESDATNDIRHHLPKNGVSLYRRGNKFALLNGANQTVMTFTFSDVSTIGGSAPADADALETTLKSYLFS